MTKSANKKITETTAVETPKIAVVLDVPVEAKKGPMSGTNAALAKDIYTRSGKVFLTVGKTKVKISKLALWEILDKKPTAKADLKIANPDGKGDYELVVA